MTEKFYIQEDGEKREATPEEVAQILADQEVYATLDAEQAAKIASRESALAKLAALGLTEDEIAAL